MNATHRLGPVLALTLFACGGSSSTVTAPAPTAATTGAENPMPSSIADPTFLEQYAVTYRFNQGQPGRFAFTRDGGTVLFLRSPARTFVNDLWVHDVATGEERVLLTAEQVLNGGTEQLSEEELARRERMRMAARGIAAFDLSPDGASILVPLSGRLFLVDRAAVGRPGAVRELRSDHGFPVDPRFSPDGRKIAVVREGDLFVIDVASGTETQLTHRASPSIEYGSAEFVAQEEMSRFEGYWWSPDSTSLLVQETDTSAVETMHILDPQHPENAPTTSPYPRPGRANARVRLGFVSLEAPRARARTSPDALRWVEWDRDRFPYVATVRWSAGADPFLLVQNRAQQDEVLLAIDVTTGRTRTLLTEHDDAWLNLDQDVPQVLAGGDQFLWTSERSGAWQLEIRARDGSLVRALTPGHLGYQSLLSVDEAHGRVFVRASSEPAELHVHEVRLDGSAIRALTEVDGTYEATFTGDGSRHVLVARTLGAAREVTIRETDTGRTLGTVRSVAEEPTFAPNVTLERVGDREFRAAILRPRNFVESQRYPVLVYVYGGPGHQQVMAERDRWLLPQWFADHGYIVVSFDGRGTPMRGREFERAIREDFISVPLEDQVAALEATLALHPEMDRTRVGIYGWSFGGYFSAMAVLRRPDVFHAGIAGAPVSEWRDYDTHYTERFLGLPEAEGTAGAYQRSSVLTFAARPVTETEPARPLLIVHGTADDNVYFSHAIKMGDALFRAGRPFDFLPLAGFTHMVPEPNASRRLQERMVGFFEQHLHGAR